MSAGWTREPPFAIASAAGALVQDGEGRTHIDLTSGWNVVNAGWNDPDIRAAWIATGLDHPFRPAWCEDAQFARLRERLAPIAPGRHVLPSCSGSESIDNALKLARLVTGRAGVICFDGAYHGSGTGAALATGYPVAHLEAFDIERLRVPLPLPDEPDCIARAEAIIRASDDAGAIVYETVLTNMACRPVPPAYRAMLGRVARELGIVLICDEIGTGINRLGSVFPSLAAGDDPDIVVAAKALTNGLYPLSLCLVRERLARQLDVASFASTYGAMPAACAAAVATLDHHAAHDLGTRALAAGEALEAHIAGLAGIDGVVGLTGTGLERALHLDWRMLGGRGLTPYALLARLRAAGVFATLSPGEDHLMLTPPLVIPHDLLADAVAEIGSVLRG